MPDALYGNTEEIPVGSTEHLDATLQSKNGDRLDGAVRISATPVVGGILGAHTFVAAEWVEDEPAIRRRVRSLGVHTWAAGAYRLVVEVTAGSEIALFVTSNKVTVR